MTALKPPKPSLNKPVKPDKWAMTRNRERITPQDYRELPVRNSTSRQPYTGAELHYRGMAA